MDKKIKYAIEFLLCKINKVTSPHRHGNKISKSSLDELSNEQIIFESSIKDILDIDIKIEISEEDRKFLCEKMKLCWHENPGFIFNENINDFVMRRCSKCGKEHINPIFDDWLDLGILYKWSKKQLWWKEFIEKYGCIYYPERSEFKNKDMFLMLPDNMIDPIIFTKRVIEFLKYLESNKI